MPSAVVVPGLSSADPAGIFLFTLAVMALLYAGLAYLMETPLGRQLSAIRTNEHRVAFLGFDPWRYKLAAFVGAACIAGASGSLYPMLRGFVSPELMFFQLPGNAVINVIVGGTGSSIGPLYGSTLLTVLRSVAGSHTPHHQLVIGLLFIVVVLLLPHRVVGCVQARLQRWLDRRTA